MELVRFLIVRRPRTLVLAVVFGLISGVLNSLLLAVANAGISHNGASRMRLLIPFLLLCLAAPLTRAVSELLLVRLGQSAIFALRTELSRQVLGVPLRHLEQLGAHRILSVLTDDIPNIANMVAVIPVLCINTGVVLGCLVYMEWLDWRLLAAVLGFVGLGVGTYHLGVGRATRHFKSAREQDNTLQKHFQGLIHGIKELKLHRLRREVFLSNLLGKTADASRRHNLSALTIYTIAASWGQLLVFVVIGLVVFILAAALNTTVGVLTGFALGLLYLMTPLQVLMNSVPGLARANFAISNVQELGLKLTHSGPHVENACDAILRGSPSAGLELVDVVFSYRHEDSDDEFTLGPINLAIHGGELLFITGGNGSGKTTLAKLLVGLYAPESGSIWYDGTEVNDANRDSYRQHFAAVFSDFFLFDALLGLEGPQLDERVRAYLASLRLDHKVQVHDGVLSTTELSQGQRKRLALLISCLEDRPVYFFDEWAADQDPVFKEIFYYSILPELKARGKTVIVISHDDKYYSVPDRIVHLESGYVTIGLPARCNEPEAASVLPV
jgi:putative ATP-binding cassette transporter